MQEEGPQKEVKSEQAVQGNENQVKPTESLKEENYNEEDLPEAYDDVVTLLAWHAPGRPYRKHSLEYFVNIFLITVAVEIIVFLFHIEILMLVILSLAFFGVVMAIVPPHIFYYKLTSEGIRIEDAFFIWDELYDFYFEKHDGVDMIKVGTKSMYPGELTLMLGDMSPQQVKSAMIAFLPFREYVKPTFTQKAGDWLGKNFPLEKAAH